MQKTGIQRCPSAVWTICNSCDACCHGLLANFMVTAPDTISRASREHCAPLRAWHLIGWAFIRVAHTYGRTLAHDNLNTILCRTTVPTVGYANDKANPRTVDMTGAKSFGDVSTSDAWPSGRVFGALLVGCDRIAHSGPRYSGGNGTQTPDELNRSDDGAIVISRRVVPAACLIAGSVRRTASAASTVAAMAQRWRKAAVLHALLDRPHSPRPIRRTSSVRGWGIRRLSLESIIFR